MKTYRVRYEIDLDADSPEQAAIQAHEMIQDPTGFRPIFDVVEWDTSGPGPVVVEVDLEKVSE